MFPFINITREREEKNMKKWERTAKKIFVITLTITIFFRTVATDAAIISGTEVTNPVIVSDSSMETGQKVTYSCIWFGSYPQTEIVDKAKDSGVYKKVWASNDDYIIDNKLYRILKSTKGWDCNGDVTVNGNKYRRVKARDAEYSAENSYYYSWSDNTTYHYFKYEPIKWRVLKVKGSEVLLLSDKVLDNKKYDLEFSYSSEESALRAWLNGYNWKSVTMDKNESGHFSDNFIDAAFTNREKSAIKNSIVENYKYKGYNNVEIGSYQMVDKIFLLSESEMSGSDAVGLGYMSSGKEYDEAKRSKSTTYAKAMGVWNSKSRNYLGNCDWWLRSPGYDFGHTMRVGHLGYIYVSGDENYNCYNGVRPALNLDLAFSDIYSYAGTVDSNGTLREVEPKKEKALQKLTVKNMTKTYSKKKFDLGVKSNSSGKLTYMSSNKKIVTVSSAGKVKMKGYGKATITITAAETDIFKETTKKMTITVKPKRIKIQILMFKTSSKLKIKWKKDKKASGYEIWLSTDKKFRKNVHKLIEWNEKVTSAFFMDEGKNRTKYYVRIRAVKSFEEKRYLGKWSKVKSIIKK